MDRLRQDFRFAVRALLKNPLVSLLAILSIGIGIGANAAVFSAVDVFMIRPLPYPEPERIVQVFTTNRERGWTQANSSIPDFRDWREQSQTLDLALYRNVGVNLSGGDRPERLSGVRVTANFFDVFGLTPARGRVFTADEEIDGTGAVALLSDGVWHRRFGADPGVLGSTVNFDGEPHTVVGILPPRVRVLGGMPDLLLPVQFTGEEPRASYSYAVSGRLRPGATLEQARSELDAITAGLADVYPETNAPIGANAVPIRDAIYQEEFRAGSLISTVAVAFVLLIACANVANLLLASGAGREREMALRSALGAGRGRILRQLLTESLLLSLIAGALGALLAVFGIKGLVSTMPSWFPGVEDIRLTPRVLGFAGLVALGSGFVFGLAPALRGARTDLRQSLVEGGTRGATGARGGRVRRALVMSEMALAMVLLIASGLLIRTFVSLQTRELGFNTSDLLTLRITLPETKYATPEETRIFFDRFTERVEEMPGVEAVGAGAPLPLMGSSGTFYEIPGEEVSQNRRPIAGFSTVTPGYFDALRIPLRAGRGFRADEGAEAPRVILINERMAERHWAGLDPVGRRISFSSGEATIVGVVGNIRQDGPEEDPEPMVFFAQSQSEARSLSFAVRTSGDPGTLAEPIRTILQEMDPDQPAYSFMSMDARIADQIGGMTIMPKIMGALAVIALLLAVVGVYGVMAYAVSQRTHEVGIRMALGAQGRDVMKLILGQGGRMAGIGILIGLALALFATKGLSIFLVGVNPRDPVTFATVTAALLLAGLLASYLPARRAVRVDPMHALRAE
jgi:putative ABC transport system permease protein